MTVSASTSAYGSASMSTRSLNVPGSDSSALQITYLGRTGLAATASHLMCVGNAAPPRPISLASRTSRMTPWGPRAMARRSIS